MINTIVIGMLQSAIRLYCSMHHCRFAEVQWLNIDMANYRIIGTHTVG